VTAIKALFFFIVLHDEKAKCRLRYIKIRKVRYGKYR